MASKSLECHSTMPTIVAIITYSLIVICIDKSLPVQSQFFTKTSKSIPRMGRRSDSAIERSPLLSPYGLYHRQSSAMPEPFMQDATIKSGAEMFPLTENSKHSTDAISSINGSGSKSVNRTPDGSSKDWIPFKYSGNRNWPSLVMTNDHTNDSEKMRSYDNSNNSVREQNYSLTGKKLASGYDERSGLAMRSLYLALLNHRLNSGKQFVSMRHYGATD